MKVGNLLVSSCNGANVQTFRSCLCTVCTQLIDHSREGDGKRNNTWATGIKNNAPIVDKMKLIFGVRDGKICRE